MAKAKGKSKPKTGAAKTATAPEPTVAKAKGEPASLRYRNVETGVTFAVAVGSVAHKRVAGKPQTYEAV